MMCWSIFNPHQLTPNSEPHQLTPNSAILYQRRTNFQFHLGQNAVSGKSVEVQESSGYSIPVTDRPISNAHIFNHQPIIPGSNLIQLEIRHYDTSQNAQMGNDGLHRMVINQVSSWWMIMTGTPWQHPKWWPLLIGTPPIRGGVQHNTLRCVLFLERYILEERMLSIFHSPLLGFIEPVLMILAFCRCPFIVPCAALLPLTFPTCTDGQFTLLQSMLW